MSRITRSMMRRMECALCGVQRAGQEGEQKVVFGGRLGEYKYYDMDAVIASALELCEERAVGEFLIFIRIGGWFRNHGLDGKLPADSDKMVK